MPVTGTNPNSNFQALKGENCTFIKVRGLKVLEDDKGNDLLKMLYKNSSSTGSSEVELAVSNLLQRIDTIEKYLQTIPPPGTVSTATKGLKGEKGDKGDDGEKGESGAQGPRGKGATKFSELLDVNIDGLDDGAVPMWSAKEKKWVMSESE
jgi:hypothetical protein